MAWVLRLALAPMVVRNHTVAPFEGGALGFKHGLVHEQTVRENDGLWAVARLPVKQLNAVSFCRGHPGFLLKPARLGSFNLARAMILGRHEAVALSKTGNTEERRQQRSSWTGFETGPLTETSAYSLPP